MDVSSLIYDYIVEGIFPLAVGLWVIGFLVLKPLTFIKNKYIPIILCLLGICGAFGLLSLVDKAEITKAVNQGVLACGVAILFDQGYKQLRKDE